MWIILDRLLGVPMIKNEAIKRQVTAALPESRRPLALKTLDSQLYLRSACGGFGCAPRWSWTFIISFITLVAIWIIDQCLASLWLEILTLILSSC